MFASTLADLAISSTQALKYWRSELVKALTTASVDEKFRTKLMLQCNEITELGELLNDALSQYIQTQRPSTLEFAIPMHVACSVTQLQLFLREVQEHHEEELRLWLQHSYLNYVPCDETIEVLAGAR